MEVPNFQGKNSAEFRIWCVMAHQQGFMFVYAARTNMPILSQAGALQSTKHIDVCRIHRETNVTQVSWIETITPR